MWSHLERQAGGRVKGMGEKQIEVDKRILRTQKYSAALALPYADQKPVFESPIPTKLIAPLSQGLSDSRRTKLTTERQQENYEFLSSCIKEDFGFKDSKPVAACVIYKCLVHWHAFEFKRTAIFYYIIEGINEVLKAYSTSQEPSVLELKEPALDEITHAIVGHYNLNFTRQDISSLWFLCKQEASLLNITDQAYVLCSLHMRHVDQ